LKFYGTVVHNPVTNRLDFEWSHQMSKGQNRFWKFLLNVLASLRLSLNNTITSELKGKQDQSYFQIETTRVSSACS